MRTTLFHLSEQTTHDCCRHNDVMSRPQHCLVYSIDAILGLTAGSDQRSSSSCTADSSTTAAGHWNNDTTELQSAAAASFHNRLPGTIGYDYDTIR